MSDTTTDVTSKKGGWLQRLKSGLSRSSGKIGDGITGIFTKRKLDDAVVALGRAKELSTRQGLLQGAKSAYNLACACALLERWPDALAALKDAIAGHPAYRASARTDEDLAAARERKEFRELLEPVPPTSKPK